MGGEDEERGVERVKDIESCNDIDGADDYRRSLVGAELPSSALVSPFTSRHFQVLFAL